MSSIRVQVFNARDELLAMPDYKQLKQWAYCRGLVTKSGFPKFKKALREIGVDYAKMRNLARVTQSQALKRNATQGLKLFSDAKARRSQFGICDREGRVVWYGKFGRTYQSKEQIHAELEAASYALWLANKVRITNGLKAIQLDLVVDAQALVYRAQKHQIGYQLTRLAKKYAIDLSVLWIPGRQNPADQWTVADGQKSWRDNDLSKLTVHLE